MKDFNNKFDLLPFNFYPSRFIWPGRNLKIITSANLPPGFYTKIASKVCQNRKCNF